LPVPASCKQGRQGFVNIHFLYQESGIEYRDCLAVAGTATWLAPNFMLGVLASEVTVGTYPDDDHCYCMKQGHLDSLKQILKNKI